MRRCKNGYPVNEDLIPPDRCHSEPVPKSCKECYNYNYEYDLIDRAIESAKCRKYYVINNAKDGTEAHQKKADNQVELMNITIKALEYYKEDCC